MRSCDWNDHGSNCDRAGFLSLCTNGAGPWYCRDHFADLMRWPRWNPLQAGTSPVIGEIKQAMMGVKRPARHPGDDEDQTDSSAATEPAETNLDDPGAFYDHTQNSPVATREEVNTVTGEIRQRLDDPDECPV